MNDAIHSLQDLRPADAGAWSCTRFAPISIGMALRRQAGDSR